MVSLWLELKKKGGDQLTFIVTIGVVTVKSSQGSVPHERVFIDMSKITDINKSQAALKRAAAFLGVYGAIMSFSFTYNVGVYILRAEEEGIF